ncbi:hypothetical protein K490DRAFT_62760 [Saccharata proteae CBS 121410]|uniref:Uncharacterized protein n=1 Tax=Saccharata proteae CBS 121410 TaxID=1314787 RepID=A0A9P4HXU7_9PEZI|nr:hypothetical protein K490DRAFT_62760 [Saccharata proteae CBS 121410]
MAEQQTPSPRTPSQCAAAASSPHPSPSSSQDLQDSPFSDYYTDPSYSPSAHPPLSSMQKTLLLQLIQAREQLLRGEPEFHIAEQVHEALNKINGIAAAPDARSKPDLVDSGLFLDEDEEGLGIASGLQKEATENDDDEEEYLRPKLLDDKQWEDVIETMTKMSSELRQRYTELQEVNSLLATKLEKTNEENLTFRAINESMRSDFLAVRSQLQFLKLQLRSLEEGFAPSAKNDFHLFDTIERWKADWRKLDQRTRKYQEDYSGDAPRQDLLFDTTTTDVDDLDMASAVKAIEASTPALGIRLPTAVVGPGSIFASPYPPSPSPSRSDGGSADLHAADLALLDESVSAADEARGAGADDTSAGAEMGARAVSATDAESREMDNEVITSAALEDVFSDADEGHVSAAVSPEVPRHDSDAIATTPSGISNQSTSHEADKTAPETPIEDSSAPISEQFISASTASADQPGFLSFLWRNTKDPQTPRRVVVSKSQMDSPSPFWDWMSNATGLDAYDDFYDDYRKKGSD